MNLFIFQLAEISVRMKGKYNIKRVAYLCWLVFESNIHGHLFSLFSKIHSFKDMEIHGQISLYIKYNVSSEFVLH